MNTTARALRTSIALAIFATASAAALAATPATHHDVLVAQADHCANCGVVQSVSTVRRASQPQGIAGTQVTPGMAIGGLVGGVLGNQVGHGNGRAVATVAGAAGGAYAGHAIEKNQAQRTAYVMRIRMQDGTIRTIEQGAPIAKGSRVVVEGHTARLASRTVHRG